MALWCRRFAQSVCIGRWTTARRVRCAARTCRAMRISRTIRATRSCFLSVRWIFCLISGKAPIAYARSAVLKAFPAQYAERGAMIEAEERDARLDTPILVAQLSFPNMPTMLHLFEPR